jgi:hypothetical protein
MVDLIFKGSRNIIHSKVMDESWVDWLISLVGISFIFYDVMEVSSQSVEAVYRLPKNMKEKDKLKSSMT